MKKLSMSLLAASLVFGAAFTLAQPAKADVKTRNGGWSYDDDGNKTGCDCTVSSSVPCTCTTPKVLED